MGLEHAADLRGARGVARVALHAPFDVKAPAEMDFVALDALPHGEAAGAVGLVPAGGSVHLRGPRGLELLNRHVPFEDARPSDLCDPGLEVADDAPGSRGLELLRPERVPLHDAGACDLHGAFCRLHGAAELGEVDIAERGLDRFPDLSLDIGDVSDHGFDRSADRPFEGPGERLRRTARGLPGPGGGPPPPARLPPGPPPPA